MSAIDDLLARIAAGLDEDERLAQAATPGPWEFEGDDPTDDELFSAHDADRLPTVAWTRDRQVANGRHMERHGPLRTLRDVASTRKLVAEITAMPHNASDGDTWFACSQAVAEWQEDAEPGSGCADEDRAGKPCDCGRDKRVERMLGIIAEQWAQP